MFVMQKASFYKRNYNNIINYNNDNTNQQQNKNLFTNRINIMPPKYAPNSHKMPSHFLLQENLTKKIILNKSMPSKHSKL